MRRSERFAKRDNRPLSQDEAEQIRLFQQDYTTLASSRNRFRKFDATNNVDTTVNSILHEAIIPTLRR